MEAGRFYSKNKLLSKYAKYVNYVGDDLPKWVKNKEDTQLQTNKMWKELYAKKHGNSNFSLKIGEVKFVLGVLILSGYHTLTSKGMYWEQQWDVKVYICLWQYKKKQI